MKIAITKETAIIVVLVLCLLGLYSFGRAHLGHSIPDEKRYIQSTKEMVESGDYITPRYHGKLRFQKPILFYWLIVLSYKLFGVGILGARFPSIISALLNVILIYLLAKDLFNKKAAIFSALVLSTSEVYFMYSRFASPDMTFLLFITASIYFFVKAYRTDIKGTFKYIYMYIFMALAMLTKGPLGFLYPMIIVCIFLAVKREWRVFKELRFLLGLMVFAAISAPWFIIMIALHGNEYIGNVWSLEIIKKLKYVPLEGNVNLLKHYFYTIFYYVGMIFVRHLPWAVFLPASVVSIQRPSSKLKKWEDGLVLTTVWFFAIFVTLILIWSKESYYVLAVSIPLSLFLGQYFSRLTDDNNLNNSILFRLPFVLAIAACFIALSLWLCFIVYILDKPILSLSLLLLVVPIFMVRAYLKRNKALMPVSFFVASVIFLTYLVGYIIPVVNGESLSNISKKIESVIKPNDAVGVTSSAVSFRRLNTLLRGYKVIRVDKKTIDGRRDLPDKKAFIEDFLIANDRRDFCITTKDDYDKFVDEGLRNKVSIMYNTFVWKRFHKQDREYFERLLTYFLEGEREKLKLALKEEIYLLSNRRD